MVGSRKPAIGCAMTKPTHDIVAAIGRVSVTCRRSGNRCRSLRPGGQLSRSKCASEIGEIRRLCNALWHAGTGSSHVAGDQPSPSQDRSFRPQFRAALSAGLDIWRGLRQGMFDLIIGALHARPWPETRRGKVSTPTHWFIEGRLEALFWSITAPAILCALCCSRREDLPEMRPGSLTAHKCYLGHGNAEGVPNHPRCRDVFHLAMPHGW